MQLNNGIHSYDYLNIQDKVYAVHKHGVMSCKDKLEAELIIEEAQEFGYNCKTVRKLNTWYVVEEQ